MMLRRTERIAAILLTLLAAAPVACARREKKPLGGDWYIVWEFSQIPEAGGTHPYLYRKKFPFGRRIEENTWRYRYLGDDCVLYVAGNSNRGELLAACGDHPPVVVADHMDDYVNGYAGDTGLTGDPVSINGRPMTVREIKARAGHGS
jgi:hypothetical protein